MNIEFTIPVTKLATVNYSVKPILQGEIHIKATYDKAERAAEIESVKWNDCDITAMVLHHPELDEWHCALVMRVHEHAENEIFELQNEY